MKRAIAPGYEALYGAALFTYEETMKEISSEVAVFILILLNNELNALLPDKVIQSHLRTIITYRFSSEQKDKFYQVLQIFTDQLSEKDKVVTFSRRYLIAMMQKELTRDNKTQSNSISAEQEFNFFTGYLMIIDEVNSNDLLLYNEIMSYPDDRLKPYRILWTLNISQYEFNEKANTLVELLKLHCLCKYALEHYKKYWGEYLNSLGFQKSSTFLASFLQIAHVTLLHDNEQVFTKLNFIQPQPDKDHTHLKALSINMLMGKKDVEVQDLKEYPLFFTRNNGYIILDETFYAKKIYRGPFFELRKQTGLSKLLGYVPYSSTISKKVLEEIFFKGIMNMLRSSIHDIIHFDSNEDNMPDCYCRKNKIIFLIEYKAYLLPGKLSVNPSFEEIKKYH